MKHKLQAPEGVTGSGSWTLNELNKRLSDMETQRQQLIPVWEEIAKYISPGRGIFDRQKPNQGERKDRHLLDPTPLQSLHVLAAGLQGGLTSPARQWFRLGVTDPELGNRGPVRLWLDDVERRMMHVLGQSNMYNCLHMLYQEVGAFGIGATLIEDDPESVLRGHTMTAGEYYVSYAMTGLPDTFGRIFDMTAAQMRRQFGEENLSDAVKNALDSNRKDEWFRVRHLIFPNTDEASGRPGTDRMAYRSVYWQEGQNDRPLRVSGYEEFPVMAPRWEVVGSDFYGRGPGWDALGEAKTLQELRKDYLIAQKMMIQPSMVGSNQLRGSHRNLRPGEVTFVNSENPNQAFRPLYQIQPDIPGQIRAMEDSREMIRRMFFADLFLAIIMSDDKNMTATQVDAINSEQMMMIGPVYERLDHELLDPLIGRTFGIMDRRGLIPEPPEELNGQELKIEYISMLAQAQQMVGLSGIDRLTTFVGGMAQLNPEVLDKFDVDEATDKYAQMLGVPAAIVRSDDTVAQLRRQRAQQQQQMEQMAAAQQMAQTAQTGAKAAQDMSSAAAGGGLEQLMGMMGEADAALQGGEAI